MTQKAVATLLRVTEFTVLDWEIGANQPSGPRVLQGIIRFLGYDPYSRDTTIRDQLQAKRRSLGCSQKDLARHLGVQPDTVAAWEKNGTILLHHHRRLVAQFLGISEQEIQDSMRRQWNANHGRSAPTYIGGTPDRLRKRPRTR